MNEQERAACRAVWREQVGPIEAPIRISPEHHAECRTQLSSQWLPAVGPNHRYLLPERLPSDSPWVPPADIGGFAWQLAEAHRLGPFRLVEHHGTYDRRAGNWAWHVFASPCGRMLGSIDGRHAHLWETATAREIRLFELPEPTTGRPILLPALDRVVLPLSEHSLLVLDTADGREIKHWNTPSPTRVLASNARGHWVLAGSDDGMVRLWEVATGGELRHFPSHRGAVELLDWSPDERLALSFGGGVLNISDARTFRLIRALHWPGLLDAKFSVGRTIVAVADGRVVEFDPVDPRPPRVLATLATIDADGSNIELTPALDFVLHGTVGFEATHIATGQTWHDPVDGRAVRSLQGIGFHALAAAIDSAQWLVRWDLHGRAAIDEPPENWSRLGALIQEFEAEPREPDPLILHLEHRAVLITERGRGEDELWRLPVAAHTAAAAPNGRWVATGTTRGELALWDVEHGRRVGTLLVAGGAERILRLVFSGDSRRLAVECERGGVLIYALTDDAASD